MSFYLSHIVHCLIQDMDSKILAEERKEMGKNARALAEREFNRINLANQFVDYLESV